MQGQPAPISWTPAVWNIYNCTVQRWKKPYKSLWECSGLDWASHSVFEQYRWRKTHPLALPGTSSLQPHWHLQLCLLVVALPSVDELPPGVLTYHCQTPRGSFRGCWGPYGVAYGPCAASLCPPGCVSCWSVRLKAECRRRLCRSNTILASAAPRLRGNVENNSNPKLPPLICPENWKPFFKFYVLWW